MGFGLKSFGDDMGKHVVKEESEWLKLRSGTVTASEAATLVGLNPYSSPAKLRNPEPFEGNSFTKVGQMLEGVVVNVVNQVLDTKFKLFEQSYGGKVFYTKEALGATPDAFDGEVLLECKTTRPHTFYKYKGYPNIVYLIQTMVQMYCTGFKEAYLGIMSTDLTQETFELKWPIVIYKVLYNEDICDILNREAIRFNEPKMFRVNSKYKKQVKLLLSLSFRKEK